MIKKTLALTNKLGLHARASMKLTDLAMGFSSQIDIEFENKKADAKSIMEVMVLGATYNKDITLIADGDDDQEAISQISELIKNRFDEDE